MKPPTKADDLRFLYEKYIAAIRERSLIDFAGCLELATSGLLEDSVPLPSELLVLLPGKLEWACLEQQFADALGSKAMIVCGPFSARDGVTAEELSKLQVAFLAGYGEVNEVRAVVQRIVGKDSQSAVPLDDVEVVPIPTDPMCRCFTSSYQSMHLSPNLPVERRPFILRLPSRKGLQRSTPVLVARHEPGCAGFTRMACSRKRSSCFAKES